MVGGYLAVCLVPFLCLEFVLGSHFRGGIIMVRPANPDPESTEMEISFHISWTSSFSHANLFCNQSVVDSGELIGGGTGNLECQYGCVIGTIIASMAFRCTDFSDSEDWSFGENRFPYDFGKFSSSITISYSGRAWVFSDEADWYIATTFSWTIRRDTGRINSSPRAVTHPVIRLQAGCNHTIRIPTSDPDNDIVRCRWARPLECKGACHEARFPGASISDATCTITYTATRGTGFKAAAIMIEDFVPGSTSPMSSVALQFLVYVFSASVPCSQRPQFIPPTLPHDTCVAIPPNATFHVSLVADSGGSENNVTEIQTVSPAGATKSELVRVGQTTAYYVNITWTPQANQMAEIHHFCFTALTSIGVSSSQQCINLLAGHFPPFPVTTSPTMQRVHPSNTTWLIRFDKEVTRPLTSAFITFHEQGTDIEVYQIDTSASQELSFNDFNEVSITPNFSFAEQAHYYINYERGIVLGVEGCRPGNKPLTNDTFWVFETLDVTPPNISFIQNPVLSRANVTFVWESNEDVTWQCELISSTQIMGVNCSNGSWSGMDLSDGTYQLNIVATDMDGNIAQSMHVFRVDTTPPMASITNQPADVSNENIFQFEFDCNKLCTYQCQFVAHDNDTINVGYSPCNSHQFTTPFLNHDKQYTFSVRPTDEIGNIGPVLSFTWHTDFIAPILAPVANATALCTGDISPASTGQPLAEDNTTAVVAVTYTDYNSGCSILRLWEATDVAGNIGSLTQVITLEVSIVLSFLPLVQLPCDSQSLVVSSDTATLPNPCERPLQLNYVDAVNVYSCPDLFTRTWIITDGCEQTTVMFNQTVSLYNVCPLNACGRNETLARGVCILGSCSCNVPWYGNECDTFVYAPQLEPVGDAFLQETEDYIQNLMLIQGTPPLMWRLISAPSQMTITQTTGIISWHRSQAGNYTVTVEASNIAGKYTISWLLSVKAGYRAFLDPVHQILLATAVQLTGHVEYTESSIVMDSLGGVVPVSIDVIRLGVVRQISTFSNRDGNFSVTFYPVPTEYGSYHAGARHPSVSIATEQTGWDFLGMRASPQIVQIEDSTIAEYQNTLNNVTALINDGPHPLHNLTADALLGNVEGLQIWISVNSAVSLLPGDRAYVDIHIEASGPFSANHVPVKVETMEGFILYFTMNLRISQVNPSLTVNPSSINLRIIPGSVRNVQLVVNNTGATAAHAVRAVLPPSDVLSVVSFGNDQLQQTGNLILNGGDSAVLTVLIRIPPEQPLADISGELLILSSETFKSVNFNFVVTSNLLVNFTVIVEDEYTYFAAGEPLVSHATVLLTSYERGIERVLNTEESNGSVTFNDIPEDSYNLLVKSPSHASFNGIVSVSPENERYDVFLARRTVEHTFTVTPIDVEETYTITLEADFETHVPIPVVTITPIDSSLEPYENGVEDVIQFNITNHGFIRADTVFLQLPDSHPFLQFSSDFLDIGSLNGLTSVLVPVQVTRNDRRKRNTDSNCVTLYEVGVQFSFVCGIVQFRFSAAYLRGQSLTDCFSDSPDYRTFRGTNVGQLPIMPLMPEGNPYYHLGDPVNFRDLVASDAKPGTFYPFIRFGPVLSTPTAEGCNKCILSAVSCVIPLSLPLSSCATLLTGGQDSIIVAALDVIGCVTEFLPDQYGCIYGLVRDCLIGRRKKRDVGDTVRDLVEAIYPMYLDALRSLEVVGDKEWLTIDDLNWLSQVVRPSLSDESDMGVLISTTEFYTIANSSIPNGATVELVQRLLERVNNTLSSWANGILEPTAGTMNLASYSAIEAFTEEIDAFNERAIAKGFDSYVDAYAYASDQYNMIDNFEEEAGVCAVVRIRIEQELALTREAFLATLEIDNRDTSSLERMRVELLLSDYSTGYEANDLFSIDNVTLSGSLVSDGNGWTLLSNHSGAAEWLIAPYSEAAPTENRVYSIGGIWTYSINGENVTVPLLPTRVTVMPDPSLSVHYFWEKYAIGNNPFTEVIEPSVPFALAVAIQNEGYGVATNLRITSGLPEIIDNDKGLVVSFRIIGSMLGNITIAPSLTVDFGDIAGNTTKVARWWILSSLQGEFKSYNASFEYMNPLGDPRLSVLDELVIHDLLHSVQRDDDDTLDFLVNDRNDLNSFPDAVYNSKTLERFNVTVGEVLSLDSAQLEFQTIVAVTNTTGWVYFRYEDVQDLYSSTISVNVTKHYRNDTFNLPQENAWITRDVQEEQGPVLIHIFDYIMETGEVEFTIFPCTLDCPTDEQPFETPQPPEPPINLQINTAGSSWIAVSWQLVPTLHNISSFIVIINGGGRVWNTTVEGSNLDTNATDLQPATDYTFTVAAQAQDGQISVPSIPLAATTAPRSPENLVVNAVGFFWIFFSWTQDMNVSLYTLRVSGGDIALNVSIDGRESNRNVSGFQPGTEYALQMTAAGIGGEMSLPSDHITATTLYQVIIYPPDDFIYTVNETDTARFVCTVAGIPPFKISWYKKGIEITEGAAPHISRSNYSHPELVSIDGGVVQRVSQALVTENVSNNDSDVYSCNASIFDAQEFVVVVQIPPLVVTPNQTLYAVEGETETLAFRVLNAHPLVVQQDLRWYFSRLFADSPFVGDSVEITGQESNSPESNLSFSPFLNNEINLTVSNIAQVRREEDPTDSGRYFLVAVNPAGMNFSYIDLVVFGPPTIQEPPENQVVVDGEDAVFKCYALAFPLHNVTWFFTPDEGGPPITIESSKQNMSADNKYSIFQNSSNPQRYGELTVNSVRYQDRGAYSCSARNDYGSDSANATLYVHVTPVINRTSPPIDVLLGVKVRLFCLATGHPLPDISWLKNGQAVDLDVLQHAGTSGTGSASGGGQSMHSGIEVKIIAISDLESGSGSLLSLDDSYSKELLALGDLGVASVLVFSSVQRDDTAQYTCVAANSHPETRVLQAVAQPIPLTVLEHPEKPDNVAITSYSSGSVSLAWSVGFDGNRQVMNYSLYQRNFTFSENDTFSLILTLDSADITYVDGAYRFTVTDSILPFRNYSFVVDACNEIGCSEKSDATPFIETEQGNPDASPTILELNSPNSTTLFIRWEPPPPEKQNGVIITYTVTYIKLDGSTNGPLMMTNTADSHIVLDRLEIYTEYNVTIAASTIAGFGPSTFAVVRTLNDTASPPRELSATVPDDPAGRTSIILMWYQPAFPNGLIIHYEINYVGSKHYDEDFFENVVLSRLAEHQFNSTQVVTAVIDNLTPSTMYTFSVTAFNGAGRGTETDTTATDTLAGPPARPVQEPTAVTSELELDDDSRTVTIVLPAFKETNGQISHYQVVVVYLPENFEVANLSHPDVQFRETHSAGPVSCEEPNQPYAYITAEFSAQLYAAIPSLEDIGKRFVVGRADSDSPSSPNDRTDIYNNDFLCFSGFYTFFIRAFTTTDQQRFVRQAQIDRQYVLYTSSDYSNTTQIESAPTPGGLIAGILFGIIIVVVALVIVIIVVFLYMKQRKTATYKINYVHIDANDQKMTEIVPSPHYGTT